MNKKSIIYTILFLIFVYIIIPNNNKSQKKQQKQIESISKSFLFTSAFDSFSFSHGELVDYEIKEDTIGYRHIKAKFVKDKILTNDEIELSVRYAFMDKMYHGKEIKFSVNKDIILDASFYVKNKLTHSYNYRTVKYIIWKDYNGDIVINNSLNIIDSVPKSLKHNIKKNRILISSVYYDNEKGNKIKSVKTVETIVRNNRMYWTIRECKTNQQIKFNDSLFSNLTFIYSLKPDNSIDSLMNWEKIRKTMLSRLKRFESKLVQDSLSKSDEIVKSMNIFKNRISSRNSIESDIGYETHIYYKLFSIAEKKNKQTIELLKIYPLSKLPIPVKNNINMLEIYSDNSSYYNVASKIDITRINEIEFFRNKKTLQNDVANVKYDHNTEYYITKRDFPYLIKDKYVIEIESKKWFKSTRIELLN